MKFNEELNVMVITTKKILNKKSPILFVSHDADDGMWQFLDGKEANFDEAMIVGLEEIVNIDNSLNDIADLELGWYAWRETRTGNWIRAKNEE